MRLRLPALPVLLAATLTAHLAAADTPLALVGARMMDGTGAPPVDQAVVIVQDGRITAAGPAARVTIPKDARRIDLKGQTLLPGFINAHGHVQDVQGLAQGPHLLTRENIERQLRLYARYGVTSVLSLGGEGDPGLTLRREPPRGRARLFTAWQAIDAATAADAAAAVDRLAGTGVDWLKVRIDDNLGTTKKMPAAAWTAVIARGRERHLPTAAHIFYLEDAKAVLRAGGTYIAHSVRDVDVDKDFVQLMRANDACYSPTLMREVQAFVYGTTPAFFADPFFLKGVDPDVVQQLTDSAAQESVRLSASSAKYRAALAVAQRNLGKLARLKVRIALGTDSGLPARFQGFFEHEELRLMVESGMTPMQALVAATGDAARCIHQSGEIGTITPGARADLAAFTKDPTKDIRATRSIATVWVDGVPLK